MAGRRDQRRALPRDRNQEPFQALIDASDAAHEIDALDPPQDDETAVYDRLIWLGTITDGLSILCTPKLRVLAAALSELSAFDEPAERRDNNAPRRRDHLR
jgi:hypothetical protein